MSEVRKPYSVRAFTLVEATISTVIVAVMLVAALQTVSSARLGEYKIGKQGQGLALALDLMAEIQQQTYEDPNGKAALGTEIGESTKDRRDFDDVDDYHNWSASPPEDAKGIDLPGLSGWERTVQVVWMDSNLKTTSVTDKGIKAHAQS